MIWCRSKSTSLTPQVETLLQPQSGAVEQHDTQLRHADEVPQNRLDLLSAEHDRQSFRRARAHDRRNRRDLDRKDVRVQKEQGADGPILRRRTDPAVNSQPGEELRHV